MNENQVEMILLRFGELTLKGKNRAKFENRMMQHLQVKLAKFERIKLKKTYGRLMINLNGERFEDVAKDLKQVFGLHSFSPVRKTTQQLEEIQQTALAMMKAMDREPKTFKVQARRADKTYPHSSQELNHLVGGYVLKGMDGLSVDVKSPDTVLHVEVREEGVFLYSEVYAGTGGFPLGSNGKALLMLSGGIDSPAAGWLAMRRGLLVEGVHFHSMPYTSEQAKNKVLELTRLLAGYSGKIVLHMVPFTSIQTRLKNMPGKDRLLITFMRRAMLRITEQIALKRKATGIVTGESLGQVASQTLQSMNVIGRVASLPILRPLVTMDKQEIIDLAMEIGTYDTSILPYEDCCTLFVPKSPSTNPNLNIVEYQEEQMDWMEDEIAAAIEQTEQLIIYPQETKEKDRQIEHLF